MVTLQRAFKQGSDPMSQAGLGNRGMDLSAIHPARQGSRDSKTSFRAPTTGAGGRGALVTANVRSGRISVLGTVPSPSLGVLGAQAADMMGPLQGQRKAVPRLLCSLRQSPPRTPTRLPASCYLMGGKSFRLGGHRVNKIPMEEIKKQSDTLFRGNTESSADKRSERSHRDSHLTFRHTLTRSRDDTENAMPSWPVITTEASNSLTLPLARPLPAWPL